ncbi:hypothetical protein FACS1894104_5650 [Actinomycetota bacterium]|nr:hypothetical protein FACS1894104_5650 [Actinomycetota bacterium]
MAVVILGSFIFATGTLITISMLPSVLISIILTILSSGSVILFLYVNHRHSFARTKPNAPLNFTVSTFQDESKRPWHRRNSFVVLYTFVTAFFACFVTSPDYGIAGILAIAVAVFLAALLQIYVIVRAQIDFSRLLPILFLPLTAISVFGLCFTDDSIISLVFVALIFFLFACYEMLNASAMYMGHDAYINSGLVAFIIDQTSSAIGLFFGWLFGLIVFYFFDWTPTATIALCFSVVLVCAIVNIFLFNKIHYLTGYLDDDPANLYRSAHIPDDFYLELPATSGDTGISGKGRFRVQCERVVKHYALSPRQADVFFLLARGHSSQHIQKELFISYHTVKSHKYSIYSKLGIHTHQELIDLVDHHES